MAIQWPILFGYSIKWPAYNAMKYSIYDDILTSDYCIFNVNDLFCPMKASVHSDTILPNTNLLTKYSNAIPIILLYSIQWCNDWYNPDTNEYTDDHSDHYLFIDDTILPYIQLMCVSACLLDKYSINSANVYSNIPFS